MTLKKKRYKPFYKKLIRLRKNINFSKKVYTNFNRKKWKPLLKFLIRQSYRRKQKYRIYDHFNFFIPIYSKFYKKKYLFSLLSKQRFNYFYGVLKRKYIKSLIRLSKKLIKNNNVSSTRFFIQCLENRIDSILYRSYFANSIREARLIIKHKHIYINNQVVRSIKHLVKPGDFITISSSYKHKIIENIKKSYFWPLPPDYLYINYKLLTITFLDNLKQNKFLTHFPFYTDLNSVINYYKR